MMKNLMMNEDFSDVTLVTEDRKHIHANKNILGLSIPAFKDILQKEKNSCTAIYLRGIKYSEMELILQFIYLGEATLYEEGIDEFLSVAKSLDIKELCNTETESNDDNEASQMDQEAFTEKFEKHSNIPDTKEALQDIGEVVDVDKKIVCGQCYKTYSNTGALKVHIQSVHDGVKHLCNWCEYQATTKGNLTVHIQSLHECVLHNCHMCDFQGKQKKHLWRHIKSKHEGIKFACDQCQYQATRKEHLTLHTQNKHEGVRYACDQCPYKARTKQKLQAHIQKDH